MRLIDSYRFFPVWTPLVVVIRRYRQEYGEYPAEVVLPMSRQVGGWEQQEIHMYDVPIRHIKAAQGFIFAGPLQSSQLKTAPKKQE
jgi:hypothetical protein